MSYPANNTDEGIAYLEKVAKEARRIAGEKLLDLAAIVRFGSPEDLPGAVSQLDMVKLHLKEAIGNLELVQDILDERAEQGFAKWTEMGKQS